MGVQHLAVLQAGLGLLELVQGEEAGRETQLFGCFLNLRLVGGGEKFLIDTNITAHSLTLLRDGSTDVFGAAHAVGGSGQDAARVPGSLAAGIQAPDGGLTAFVPGNADGRGAAALHGGQHRVGLVVALQLPPQDGQCLCHGFRHKGGQTLPQIGPGDAGAVAGFYPARSRGGALQKKVLHPLGGSPVAAASQGVGGLLQRSLELDACQGGAVAAEILRRDVHQQGAVDIFPVPGKFAHAVGNYPALLRGGGHHLAAGTDAEGKGGAAVRQMAGQLIGGGGQAGVPGVLLVLGGVAV